MNADRKAVSVLCMLDLTAGFDALDYEVPSKDCTFGSTGHALRRFSSCLSDRHQSVAFDHFKSRALPLKYGVPQGSVLGPVLFTLYTLPLSDVISYCGSKYQNALKTAPHSDLKIVLKNMELCVL